MALCGGARLALLVYGLLMHGAHGSPAAGLRFPGIRPEDEAYEDDGYALLDSDPDPPGEGSPASASGLRHLAGPPGGAALGTLDQAYRRLLGRLSATQHLQTLAAQGAGGSLGITEEDCEPLSKRHSDGIFTDSYSRYRKQMAVKKYLEAVLGKRYKQRARNKGRRIAYL
ncbi:pituitary adenylate cyclase-activating polypeptide isoform X2 [Erinaceus europaeus]|nr:pituitary adenylate cyclase-activating polypeptide isoform X2 [Erinaceus europaeus]